VEEKTGGASGTGSVRPGTEWAMSGDDTTGGPQSAGEESGGPESAGPRSAGESVETRPGRSGGRWW
jgi:hypothetical protein